MQISNDWFVAETEFENKSFIIRGRLFLDTIRQSGKFATYRSRMGISGR